MGKIYAVKKGRQIGIFNSWDECKKNVDGFSGAEYKGFKESQIDDAYIYCGIERVIDKVTESPAIVSPKSITSSTCVDVYVDGSFKNGNYSYAFVVVSGDNIIHTASGVGSNMGAASMMNVAGELSAAMNAIYWIKDKGLTCNMYHDYEGIGNWATGKWKAKNEYTKAYTAFIQQHSGVVKKFIHVYGHTGNKYNELADDLAGKAFYKNEMCI